jgi:spermidine synthase
MALSSAERFSVPSPNVRARSRALFATLAVLFFCSGAAALVYQVLWLRLLGLVFGVTVHAATTVLASFMSGLALGSVVAGRLAPRLRRPLAWFAAAELLIAIAALATQPAIAQVTALYVAAHPGFAGIPGGLTAIRFAAAWAVLLVPTALMGASLPLVLKSSLARDAAVGARFAALYAANTAGAIAGTLLVGFVLIERIGIAASFQVAAAINLAVAAVAFALDRARPAAGGDDRARPTEMPLPPLTGEQKLMLAVFAASGFAALALEIVWFRLLVLFVPATTYAFSTMLAAVLFGIAAGSALAPALLRRDREPRRLLAYVEVAVGFAALLSVAALTATYRAGWRTTGTIQASLLTIAPACVLMGLAFPLGVVLIARSAPGAGAAAARVAMLYSVNVAGAIAGAAAGGFLLIPRLGIAGSLIAIAAVHVAAGLLLFGGGGRIRAARAAAVLALFAAAAAQIPDPVTSVIRRRYGTGERVWWREEGAQSTVSVHVRPGGGRQILYLDGLHQANDSSDMVRVHRQIGHLPMALHPDPRRALVIGLGAGATAGAVSRHARTDVTVVELSPSVVRAARTFSHINDGVVDADNVRFAVDDARNHLLVAGVRYDVITADIIQPIHAGAGNLYSREYFTLVRSALADGGLALQWIGHRGATPYRLIMRTFLSVFPHATLWAGGTLMVGSLEPLVLSREAFERKLADARTRAALADVGWATFEDLLHSYTAGPEEMRAFVGGTPVLTDDRPRIEYFGSLPETEPALDFSRLRGDVRRHLGR